MASSPQLPKVFVDLEQRLQFLQSLRDQGRITPQAYDEEVQGLTAKDPTGRTWWLGGEVGAWHWWDGKAWVRGQPPTAPLPAEKPAKAGTPKEGKPPRRLGLFAGLGCAALVVVCLVATGAFLAGGYGEYQALPKIVEAVEVDVAAAAPLALSSDQAQVRAELGDPEAFMILFYEEPLDDGSVGDVRTETWTYYTRGVEYTFINGEQVGEDPIEVELVDLAPVPYRPEQFDAYMGLEEVLATAGVDSFVVVPLERELVEGGEVYYADRLTFGLKGDELRYVEALALDVEG